MRILALHNSFPAQYRHLLAELTRRGHEIAFISRFRRSDAELGGVRHIKIPPVQASDVKMPGLETLAEMHATAQAFSTAMQDLQKQWRPDVVLGHPSWGALYYVRDIFPAAAFLPYCEWYYTKAELYSFFNKKRNDSPETWSVNRVRNTFIGQALLESDAGISPTFWQRSQFPPDLRHKIRVIHDGIDTSFFSPGTDSGNVQGLDLKKMPEIVTYTARGMEPYRGFPQFCQALPEILKRRPGCHAVIMANPTIHYSRKPSAHENWLMQMKSELPALFNHPRLHILKYGDYASYRSLLRHSSVHVYLTVPFVLSWSMLEAMACRCLLVASDTSPVREIIKNGVNGILAPFFDSGRLADRVVEALENRAAMDFIAENARNTILEKYDLKKLLPLHVDFVENAGGARRQDVYAATRP